MTPYLYFEHEKQKKIFSVFILNSVLLGRYLIPDEVAQSETAKDR